MKRGFIFLLLGPASVFLVFLVPVVIHAGLRSLDLPLYIAMTLFFLTFIVAAITAPVDGYLARALPIPLRMPIAAIVGGTVGAGEALLLSPHWFLQPFAIGGAICMGMCSLLSHDYGKRQQSIVPTKT